MKPIPVSDLSALPSPYLDRTLELGDYDGVLWELSRGCPFSCDFCYESRGAAGIRRFPMDRVLDELRLFDAAGVEQVFVLDPTFNYDKAMAKRILKHIQELAPEIYFCFEVRSESIDAELAECFGAVNCTLQIGLQSASDAVLRNVNRSLDRPDFEQKVFLLHQAGVVYGFDLIYGLPGDSYEGFCESLDYAMGFIPNHVDLFPLAVLPGTRLQETAASLGVTHQLSAPYHVTDVRGFPEEDLIEASELSAAFDLFYNKGQAVPWFDIVVRALDMAPSAFFDELATWLLTAKAFADVVELQSCFVAEMLVQAGKAAFVELASDLVTYFGSFEALVDTETSVCFHHDPVVMLDLLCSGIADLEELSAMLPKRACLASVSLQDGEPSILIRDREDAMDLRPL
ncbi:MAG: radical SAM protein [Verrucomicrobia bacterium]|nr:radical SAM protein [Verrucomicrobiota bacterium]